MSWRGGKEHFNRYSHKIMVPPTARQNNQFRQKTAVIKRKKKKILHENSFKDGWLTVTICQKRNEMFYHKVKCFKILKKILKILILYWLPTNIYILDIKYKLHLTMLGKKFWLKKIFYIRHLCFKSVLSHNVKKN